jgi:hypothetical protein
MISLISFHWSYFLRAKSGLIAVMIVFLQLVKTLHQIDVAFIHLDNSNENIAMKSLIRSHGFGITFEYISVGSPQYNGVVECAFATLYGMVRSMLNAAKVPTHLRHDVWPEAACTATQLKNLLVSYSQTKSLYELFHGLPSDHVPFLKTFGEMAVVENVQTHGMCAKLVDCGKPVMYLGMVPNHAKDTYCFLNIATSQVINSRNVVWLHKSYGDFMKLGPDQVSFIQSRLLERLFPPPGIPPSVADVPVALPPPVPPGTPLGSWPNHLSSCCPLGWCAIPSCYDYGTSCILSCCLWPHRPPPSLYHPSLFFQV